MPWFATRPIAHRGMLDNGPDHPENSLPAFLNAIKHDVPFELDVQLTRDGCPIVAHDADFARVTGTDIGPITGLDRSSVAKLRMAPSGEKIPTLDDVLALVDGAVPFVVDVRRWGLGGSNRLEQAIADRLRDYDHPVVVQSFDPVAVYRLRRLLPNLPVGQVSGELRSAGPVLRALGQAMPTNVITRPDFITYELTRLPSPFASLWRGPGRPLIAFTSYSPADEQRALAVADNFFFSGYLPDWTRH